MSDSKSNLRFDVLADLLALGSVPVEAFELKANLIDVLLCDRRNSVAHGRDLFLDASESAGLGDEVITLMETMRDVLVTQVRAQGYIRL